MKMTKFTLIFCKGKILNSTTASFNAITASTVSGMDGVTKEDVMFFNKGMMIENDALDVEQTSNLSFLMQLP